ncbi:hypothetical protein E2F46_06925 [Luteimonas aestuarii]|uniref:Core-binding (CB) domain-containing protein n=1 Tax=Luteimonas aestuarii TaxID=453837 RepID=A0A4V3AMC0_9GAMM|nr:integrase domain-containing protein [Luteimonas aestuarii]TDK26312.1 hypothetical protein E2F46_06925 [Luteimonas aestuarii]
MTDTPYYLLMQQARKVLALRDGARLTRKARRYAIKRAVSFLAKKFHLTNLKQVRSVHLQALAGDFLDDGNSIRSVQNYMAHIRFLLRKSGRGQLLKHPTVSNFSLGISGGNRGGVREPLEEPAMAEFARQAGDLESGVASVIELGYFVGLRVQEAVMCSHDLANWESTLRQSKLELPELRVSRGAKGGRLRQAVIIDVPKTLDAIGRAREVAASTGGFLIPGELPQAIARVYSICSRIGMTGAQSPHAARYGYCCCLIRHLHGKGWTEREALAKAANALGHGAQRTDWVRTVYGQTVRDLWRRGG